MAMYRTTIPQDGLDRILDADRKRRQKRGPDARAIHEEIESLATVIFDAIIDQLDGDDVSLEKVDAFHVGMKRKKIDLKWVAQDVLGVTAPHDHIRTLKISVPATIGQHDPEMQFYFDDELAKLRDENLYLRHQIEAYEVEIRQLKAEVKRLRGDEEAEHPFTRILSRAERPDGGDY